MSAWFQYQVKAEPLQFTGDPVVNLDHWEPRYPERAWPTPRLWDPLAIFYYPEPIAPPVILSTSWSPAYPDRIEALVRLWPALQQAFALHAVPLPNPVAPDFSWQALTPNWLPPLRAQNHFAWFGPIGLSQVIPQLSLGLTPAFVGEMREQTSGSYYTLLVDEFGDPVAPAILTSLTLTLYTIRADRTIAFINGREVQNVLNQNNVIFHGVPQVRSDGCRYNLRWLIQHGDTTLVSGLSFERHIALFEYQWPSGKQGKHEIVLNIRNLGEV
jgi:hypothetical protein